MSQANKPKSINLIPKYFCDNQYFWCEREFQLRIFKTIKDRQPILFWCKISHCVALKIFAEIRLTLEANVDQNYSATYLTSQFVSSDRTGPGHWGCLSQKHTVWREGGGSLTAPTIVHHIWYSTSITLVTGMVQATFWIFGFGVLSRLWAFVPVCLYIADADVNDICSNICQSAPTCPQHVCQRKRLESNGKVYF